MRTVRSERTFVIGDIHGAYKAFMQCLHRAAFDYERDRLICLGDVCDGWPQVKECFTELRKMKNVVLLLGNHDEMALEWMLGGGLNPVWLMQGGNATRESFGDAVETEYIDQIKNSRKYYVWHNSLFVHAGCIPKKPLHEHSTEELIWDRTFVEQALKYGSFGKRNNITGFEAVFIGHTPTIKFGKESPFQVCEVWFMDSGAGWHGKLSMMNIDTHEIFQSDKVPGLYPDHPGRF